jgi:hypothetical protein
LAPYFGDSIFIDIARHPVMKELEDEFHGPIAMAIHSFTSPVLLLLGARSTDRSNRLSMGTKITWCICAGFCANQEASYSIINIISMTLNQAVFR